MQLLKLVFSPIEGIYKKNSVKNDRKIFDFITFFQLSEGGNLVSLDILAQTIEEKEIQTFFSVIFYPIFLYTSLVQKYPEFIINLYKKKSILFMHHHPLPELYVFLIIWIWVLRSLIYFLLLPKEFFDEHQRKTKNRRIVFNSFIMCIFLH